MRRALLAVLILLAASPLLGASGQAPPSAPPSGLTIDSISASPKPVWLADVPNQPRVEVFVENTRSIPSEPYTLEYRWVGGGTSMWLQGTAQASTDAGAPLSGNGGRVHWIDPWNMLPGQQGQGALQVTLLQGQQIIEQVEHPLFIPVRALGLSFADPSPLTVFGDETGFFQVQVTNLGNRQETVELALVQDHDRIEEQIQPDAVVLAPGATRASTLFLHYPFQGDLRDFTTIYSITATTADGLWDAIGGEIETPQVHVGNGDSGRTYSFSIEPEPGRGFVAAGQETTTRFRITNTGTGADAYRLVSAGVEGWDATKVLLGGLELDRIALEPGQAADVDVTVLAPGDAPAGHSSTLHATLQSDVLGVASGTLTGTRIVQVDGPSVMVLDLHEAAPVYVGSDARLEVELANHGNRPTPADTPLRIIATAPSGGSEHTIPVPAIGPGARRVLEVVLPSPSAGGEMDVTGHWPGSDPTGPASSAETQLFVHAPALSLVQPTNLSGTPGERVSYQAAPHAFLATNQGNAAETFTIMLTATNLSVAQPTGEQRFALEPGSSRSVPFTHLLPRPAGAIEDAVVHLTVQVEGKPQFHWNGTVATAIVDRSPPTLQAIAPPSLWSHNVPRMPVAVEASDDSAVAAVHAVLTHPDGAVETTALEEGPSSWIGNVLTSGPGEYALQFFAVDRWGNQRNATIHTFEVAQVEPPLIVAPFAPGETLWVDTPVCITVADKVGIASVAAGANGSALIPLPSVGDCYVLDPSRVGSGSHQLVIEATNVAGESTRLGVDVEVRSPPTLPLDDSKKDAPMLSVGAVLCLVGLAARRRRP